MLTHLVSAIGLTALKDEAAAVAARAGKRAALYVLVGILWLVALGFLVAALTIWLAGLFGAVVACIVIAAALVVIGLIIQVALMLTARRRRRSEVNLSLPGLSATASASGPGADIGALAIVAIVGWLLGRQMRK